MLTWQKDNPDWGHRELHYAFNESGWKVGTVIQFETQLTWIGIIDGKDCRAISLEAGKAWVEAQLAPTREEVGNG